MEKLVKYESFDEMKAANSSHEVVTPASVDAYEDFKKFVLDLRNGKQTIIKEEELNGAKPISSQPS